MRVLLDTNIIIHREANRVVLREIGILFNWLDRLKFEKCVHPLTISEIRKHKDANVVDTFEAKINSYVTLKTLAPESPEIRAIRAKYDTNDNDVIDTSLLKELFAGRVDFLITEDKKVHLKAKDLGIDGQVYTVDGFLEKVVAENPDFVDYRVLAVKRVHFGDLDIQDSFFDSFKRDYIGFEAWYNRKADEFAYCCLDDDQLVAFLYIKVEDRGENYIDITPGFAPKKRLKIGTFKVSSNGLKLGERFLKIIFDNALRFRVEEIYVTIFDYEDQRRLIELLQDWGFNHHGVKQSPSGTEQVYVRDFTATANITSPNLTYPFFSLSTRKFIVPIYPEYHTELLPDSLLRTESAEDFADNRPNRNAISKVYVSRSFERSLESGDLIVFYRTAASNGSAYYTSVATTLGVVQSVEADIPDVTRFIELCRKRSVFSDEELKNQWNFNPKYRPFIVNFLYILSFQKRPNLKLLQESGIISKAPRGFEELSDTAFNKLMEISDANQYLAVDQT